MHEAAYSQPDDQLFITFFPRRLAVPKATGSLAGCAAVFVQGPTSTLIEALDRLAFLRGPDSDVSTCLNYYPGKEGLIAGLRRHLPVQLLYFQLTCRGLCATQAFPTIQVLHFTELVSAAAAAS